MEEDGFWQCYGNGGTDLLSRDWLVPGPSEKSHDDAQAAPPTRRYIFSPSEEASSSDVTVRIRELCSEGCLNDVIGGEVWEASFLLSAFVLLNPSLFSPGQRVLELGAGVGLPSLLLLELRRRKRREGEDIQAPGELTLTDNDSVVLGSLHTSAVEEGGVEDSCKEKKGGDGDVALSVRYFDWLEPANIDPSLHDLVIGSALVYSPEHAVALSNTVSHLLLSPTSTVSGIIVIQIGDRPGFERLQRLLSSVSGVSFAAHAVSEEVYDLAQQSKVHTSTVSSSFFRHKNITFRPRALEGAGVHKVISTPRESFTILTITKD
jgi:hypothetical protein